LAVFAKAQILQPGGSLKDRAALHILRQAQWKGAGRAR